jgi:hypothetical protein
MARGPFKFPAPDYVVDPHVVSLMNAEDPPQVVVEQYAWRALAGWGHFNTPQGVLVPYTPFDDELYITVPRLHRHVTPNAIGANMHSVVEARWEGVHGTNFAFGPSVTWLYGNGSGEPYFPDTPTPWRVKMNLHTEEQLAGWVTPPWRIYLFVRLDWPYAVGDQDFSWADDLERFPVGDYTPPFEAVSFPIVTGTP